MKAIIYTKYGSPDVLELKDVAKPSPKPDEVRIKVFAVEATKADCELRSSKFAVKWFWIPLRIAMGIFKPRNQILGCYFAGEIESIGEEVNKFIPGDQVFGSAGLGMGAYAEYMCLSADSTLVSKPVNMTFEQAASVPLGALNALHFMSRAKIQSGEHVLINGAGGSIGTFALQIAKIMGAQVTAVDSAIKEEMLFRIGADHFIDYTKEDFTSSDQNYDVILDMVAQSSYIGCVNALKAGGRYLMGNPRISDMLRSVITTKFTDKNVLFAFAGEKESELLELKQMIEDGKIAATIDSVLPLEQAAEAHRRVEAEERLGCVVLNVANIEEIA